MANFDYKNENITKKVSSILIRVIFLGIIGIAAFILSVFIFSKRVERITNADLDIETVRLRNAIESYKIRTGEYPDLSGNENSLQEIKSSQGGYTFELFYGDEKIYEIPGNMAEGIIKTNSIVTVKDDKGGWVYDVRTGEIFPNIED